MTENSKTNETRFYKNMGNIFQKTIKRRHKKSLSSQERLLGERPGSNRRPLEPQSSALTS